MKPKPQIPVLLTSLIVAITGAAFCILLNCGGSVTVATPEYVPPPPPPEVRPPTAMLKEAGTIIQANDNSFQMHPNMNMGTPFQSSTCPVAPTTETFEEALHGGARPVMVTTPFHDTPLYGLLSFCPLPNGTTGPASRMHLVQVPQEYVNATANGLISVVYEPVYTTPTTESLCTDTCSTPYNAVCEDGGQYSTASHCALGTDCNDCGSRTNTTSGSVPAWILYLSRQPFPGASLAAPTPGGLGAAPLPVGAVQRPPTSLEGPAPATGSPPPAVQSPPPAEDDAWIQDMIKDIEAKRGTPLTPKERKQLERKLKGLGSGQ